MALETCKECSAQISDKAASCPSCGAPIKRTSLVGKLAAGFLGLAVFSGIVGSCSQQDQKEASTAAAMTPAQIAAKAERDEQAAGAYACKTFIEKSLKDPDSAQFIYSNYEAPSKKNSDGFYEVQHKVRAKNSFGAYNLSYFNCILKKTEANWILVTLKEVK